jgi:hypothetical protein
MPISLPVVGRDRLDWRYLNVSVTSELRDSSLEDRGPHFSRTIELCLVCKFEAQSAALKPPDDALDHIAFAEM